MMYPYMIFQEFEVELKMCYLIAKTLKQKGLSKCVINQFML